ncbi:phage protein [Streptococcus pneumoniae]|nr:phage protein [Streptococcus pneumoniae]
MNKQELIERIEGLKNLFCNKSEYIEIDSVIRLISELDEPETGHADEAPRYVKNILARLRELPVHDREVWLKAIMGEFEQDFSHAKWREGYEQGKFEGAWVGNQLKDADKIRQELNRVKIPSFVAEYIEFKKKNNFHVYGAMRVIEDHHDKRVPEWFYENNIETFARAWLDGYEVEEEKRYMVKMKGMSEENTYGL